MHIFQINSIRGIIHLIFMTLGTLLLVVGLPTVFAWVTWNALVFDTLGGPEINFWQALILWGIGIIMFQLVFKPEISFHIKQVSDPNELEKHLKDLKDKHDIKRSNEEKH